MRPWLEALLAAGVTPASFAPDAGRGEGRSGEPDEPRAEGPAATVELVEDGGLAVHPVVRGIPPAGTLFLDGIQRWKVVGYDGVLPVVIAYVAAAVRRRGADRRPVTAAGRVREFAIAPVGAMDAGRRRALEICADVVPLAEETPGQPGELIEAARREVHRARAGLEKELAEEALAGLGPEEWLVVDGQLSVSARLAHHPRALGVIKSHGAQFLEGRHLQRALTVPADHRTSVFRVKGGHGRTDVDSWYLRLWPWEGNDLLYGLLRIEARAHDATLAAAPVVSAWLLAERAPLSTPDPRFDRLLYPIHDVETYLRSRAPRDLFPPPASRLPRTGS